MRTIKIGLLCLLLSASQWLHGQTPLKLIVTDPSFTSFTAGDITAFKNTFVTRSFLIRNTSNTTFTGRVLLKDVFGSSLSVEDITITYEDGTLPKGTAGSPIDANWMGLSKTLNNPISGTDYYIDITNLPSSIGKNAGLIITRRVKIIDCIDDNSKGKSEVYLSVCDGSGSNCQNMTDAWENTNTRLIQRISKKNSEFVDIVDYEFRNGGYCSYNSSTNNTDGYRTVSLVAKMHNATDGESIERFGFQLSASDKAEIPNSRVKIYKAIKNGSGKYVPTGAALNITPTVELNPVYHYIPVFLANPRCSPDAIQYAFYEIGTMSGSDAYYIEFDVLNCQYPIDVKNLNTNINQDDWAVYWRGLDNCNTILSNAPNMPQSCGVSVDDQDIRPTSVLSAGSISGANYGDYVYNKFTYTERVSSLFANTVGNNRLSNTFVSNSFSFLGTCYSDGFNYQVDRGKIVVALKMESGLNYYTGPTTGGYFDRMHFRNPDGTQWNPTSQLGSPTALYNIPTDESPLKAYDEIHFFEFDLTTLYALYPAAQTATSNQKRSLLYQYLNASDLVYAMQADCGAPNQKDLVNYTVEMYFVLDGSCSNPFVFPSSKITRDAKIMCPGCMFPGGAGAGVSIQRSTFGYRDANDNHVPDNPATLLTEAQVLAINGDNDPDNNIRTSFGIVGDHVKMKTEYYLTGSEGCNGNTWDDMMIGPLTYSYLYIHFPKDTIAIDTSIPIKFKIKSGGNVYSFTAPVSAIVDLGNGPTQHIFALNTSILNTYLDAGSPSLPNGFRFHSFDKVEYEFELNVLLNSNTTESYQEVFFTHSPYFSAVPLSQRTGDFPQFSCDPIYGPSWKDANGNVNLVDLPPPYASNHPYSTTFLLCEGYETIFNLVPVIQQVRYDGTGGGATAETDPNCVKERDYGIVSSIGLLDEKRLFLNEVREAPYLNEIDVIIPSGYKLLEFYRSTAMYSDNLPWYSRNEDRAYNLTPTSSQTFVVGGETFTKEHYVFPSPILKNDDDVITYDPTKIGEARIFDEKSYQHVGVYYEAICSEIENKPDLIAAQSTTNQTVMNKVYFDHDNISPFDEFLMTKSVNFLKPSNGLTSTISTTGIVGAVSSSFNVNFAINQSSSNTKTPARYPFISIEYTPSDFSNFNLTTTSGYPVTLVESTTLGNGNVKALYSITINPNNRATTRFSMSQNQSIPFNISGQLEKCFDNPNSPASFKVGYGWDCNGFPTSVADLASKCFIQEEEIKVYSIQSGLQSELTAASLGDRCLNPKIKYTHRLVSTGSQVNQVSYTIDLPDGLTLATGSIDIQYGSASIAASDYTVTNISTPTNQGVYELVLSPTALTAIPFAGAVVQGNRQEELILTFNARVASGCNVYLATSLSKIDVTATNFCYSTLQNHSEVIPDYEACDNTYTVSIQGEQLYCANANIASPITLTAVIPPLSPTVCYTLPITYEWKISGTSTVISTSDILNTTITQATTFEVTTTDAAGRKATASYTVDYDVEYQIGSINYVCGDPNRSICVPIDAKRVVRNGIIGMDFCLKYDKRFVSPNTVVNNSNLGTVVTSGGAFQATYFMTSNTFPVVESDPNIGYVHVSIYYTSVSSSSSAQFVGSGRVMCVPFTVLGNPPVGQGFTFEMCEIYESYTLQERRVCWGPGQFNVTYSPNMKGQLTYYQPNQVALAQQTVGFPYFATNTIKTSAGCVDPTIGTFTTDNNGGFNFNIGTANTFSIERDIHNYFTTPYSWYFRQFVNAVDTRAMEFITTMNATSVFSGTSTFKPSAGQMIAADVNMSDSIRSNDITLTQKRMIGLIGEYPQVQNRVSKPSLDWRFIEDAYNTTLTDFTRSVQYPFYDGSNHYWRDNVPNVPNCFAIQQQCYNSPTPLYRGILLGDLINSSSAYFSNPYIRTSEKQAYHYEVNIDDAIAVSDREYLIPVYYQTADTTTAYAFDFDLEYQTDSLMITGLSMDSKIEENQPRLAWTDMADDGSLRSTNYTMDFWSKSGTVYYISVVRFNNNPLTANDFKEGYGLINGVKSEVYIRGTKTASTTNTQNSDLENGWLAQVVPNPANDQGKIVFRFTDAQKDNAIRILDVIGHEISNYSKLPQEGSISLSDLAAGMYIAHVFDKSTGTSRVIKFIKK